MIVFPMLSASETKNQRHSIELSTGYWVTRLAKTMEEDFEKRLKLFGVSRATCAILSAVYHNKKDTPAALASFIGIDGAAITRHLDRIEKSNLMTREPNPVDRRSIRLSITRKGSRLIPKLVAASKATNSKFLDGITRSERKDLLRITRKMLSNTDHLPTDI